MADGAPEVPLESGRGYEAPHLAMHGSVVELTQAAIIGIFVDNNHSQGSLIINNTSA